MNLPASIGEYLRAYGAELGDRVLNRFPALQQPEDAAWPVLDRLRRKPFSAQALAVMGIVKRWEEARCFGRVGGVRYRQDAHLAR